MEVLDSRYEELVSRKLELEEKSIDIKMQLEYAKANYFADGEKSDPKWYSKAKYAYEKTKMELKKVNAEYEIYKREMKAREKETKKDMTKSFERTFMEIAKQELPSEIFDNLKSLTFDFIHNNK